MCRSIVCGCKICVPRPIFRTLYTLHFTLHTLHNPPHTLDLTLYVLHFPLCTPHCTLYTPRFTLHTLHFTLHTPHSTLSIPHCRLFTGEFVQDCSNKLLQTSGLCDCISMCFHICTINMHVSIRVRGLHLFFSRKYFFFPKKHIFFASVPPFTLRNRYITWKYRVFTLRSRCGTYCTVGWL